MSVPPRETRMGDAEIARILRPRGDGDAMNTQTASASSLKQGERWTFRDVFDVAADGSELVYVENDLSSDALRVVSITIRSSRALTGSVEANSSVETSGSPLPVQNDRIDADVADLPAGVVVESGGTYTAGEAPLPISTVGGDGSGSNRTALNQLPTANVRIEPGASLLWTLTDDSGNGATIVFEVVVARE